MGASHATEHPSPEITGIVFRQDIRPGIPVNFLVRLTIAQIRQGKKAGAVRIVHKDIIPQSVRFIGIDPPIRLSFRNSVRSDALFYFSREFPAEFRLFLILINSKEYFLRVFHGLHRHYL